MKKIRMMIAITALSILPFSSIIGGITNVYGTGEEPRPNTVFPETNTRCIAWKNVCVTKTFCTRRDGLRGDEVCFRCLKPSHYGVHLFPRMQSRQTCNLNTVDYLRAMGYRCYKPYESTQCISNIQREECHLECTEHEE